MQIEATNCNIYLNIYVTYGMNSKINVDEVQKCVKASGPNDSADN